MLSFVYVSVSTKLVLQLFNASHDIAFNIVVALYDVLLHTVELAVGVIPFVVYLICVHPAHTVQLIVFVLPLNQYPTGVHVGAAVGAVVSIVNHDIVKIALGFQITSVTLIVHVV